MDASPGGAVSYFGNVGSWVSDGANWHGAEGVPHRFIEHVQVSFIAIVVATLIAVPIGLVLGHYRRGGFAAVNLANLGRALPSFAILLMAVLVFGIGNPPRLLRSIGVVSYPTFLALVALAIPPIVTNTYLGVTEIDPEIRDAARGMGMSGRQVLRRVELPLASPLMMAGIRTSAVGVVATATLLAYVGGGGLGRFIIDGAAISFQDPRIFVGATAVALLAIAVELALGLVQRLLVPKDSQRSSKGSRPPGPVAVGAVDAQVAV